MSSLYQNKFHWMLVASFLEKNKQSILESWINSNVWETTLQYVWLDKKLFYDKYAVWLIDYFIWILKWVIELWHCPKIVELINYMISNNVESKHVFNLTTTFRKVVMEYMIDSNEFTHTDLFFIIDYFDQNFESILDSYDNLIKERSSLADNYKLAIDASSVVSITDLDWIITYVNDKLIEISWYTRKELIWKTHNVINHPDMPKELFDSLWNTIKNKNIWTWSIKNRKKDWSYFRAYSTIVPILDHQWNIKEFIWIRNDITKQKEYEERINRYKTKEIERLQEVNELKDKFVNMASHEMRSPLTSMRGILSMMNDWDLWQIDDVAKSYIQKMLFSAEDLLDMINDLLDLRAIESWKMELVNNIFDVKLLLEWVVDQFNIQANSKKQIIETDIDFDRVNISLDKLKFKQIVTNLISNAIKYTLEWWHIKVLSRIEWWTLNLIVQDDWIWIAESDIPKIFQEFWRIRNKKTKWVIWTWLWLPIVKAIVRKMWWAIDIHSKENEWTTFKVTIPLN